MDSSPTGCDDAAHTPLPTDGSELDAEAREEMWRLRQMALDEESDDEDSDYWDESTDESDEDEDEDEDETQQRHSSTYLDRPHDTALLPPAGATLRHCAL